MEFLPIHQLFTKIKNGSSMERKHYSQPRLPPSNRGLHLHHEHELDLSEMSFGKAMFAGSTAGVTEHICMYPVDTVKTRMQAKLKTGVPVYKNVVDAFTTITRTEGIARLYRGLPAILAGAIPSHAIYFAVYEFSKEVFGANKPGHHPFLSGAAGSCAIASHDAVVTPLDVVKQRLQVANSRYENARHCAKDIFAKEGFSAFYGSYPTTVMMNIPFMAVHFACYESFKIILSDEHGHHGPVQEFLAGGGAGAAGGLVSTPFDVIKTRIQTKEQKEYLGPVKVVRDIMKEEGVMGFTRGMQARVLYFIPSAAICWTTYETMKKLLKLI